MMERGVGGRGGRNSRSKAVGMGDKVRSGPKQPKSQNMDTLKLENESLANTGAQF